MNFIKEYLPVIITFLTTYSGLIVFLKKLKDLGLIKDLKAKIDNLQKQIREERQRNTEILEKLDKIERQQRGLFNEEETK